MTGNNPRGIAVGDTVVIVAPSYRFGANPRAAEATVARVARKYAYIDDYRSCAFDLIDGRERSDYSPRHMYTLDEWAAKQRRDAAMAELHRRGIRWDHGGVERRYSADTLEWVVAALRCDPNDIDPVQR